MSPDIAWQTPPWSHLAHDSVAEPDIVFLVQSSDAATYARSLAEKQIGSRS
ncbi:hypothetical protein ABHI18_012561 [Aspergillus niger]